MKKWPTGLVMVGITLSLVLLACAPQAPTPAPQASPTAPEPAGPAVSPEWQKVLEVASKERRVTIYNGIGAAAASETIVSEFPKQTGIIAEVINIGGSESREKVRVEQQSGAYTVDAIVSGISTPADLTSWGFTQPVGPELPAARDKNAFRVDPWQFSPSKQLMVFLQEYTAGVLVNTKMVKEGEIQSWNDLLDPKWKGKIVILDPRFSGGATIQAYSATELGMDFWKQMAGQNLRFERNPGRVTEAVALGEKAIAIFAQSTVSEQAILAGAPVKYLHLKEGSYVVTWAGSVIKNAPHPNASMVFLNWLISRQGHETLMRSMRRAGIRKDIDPVWLTIPEFRPEAPKKLFSKVASGSADSQEAISFMRQALGTP